MIQKHYFRLLTESKVDCVNNNIYQITSQQSFT